MKCTQCGIKPPTLACACGHPRAVYCSNRCADIHWTEHGHRFDCIGGRNADGKREREDDDDDLIALLVGPEEYVVTITKGQARECRTLANLLEDSPDAQQIPLPNITYDTALRIQAYLRSGNAAAAVAVGMKLRELLDLLVAVNYLDIELLANERKKSLLALACDMIRHNWEVYPQPLVATGFTDQQLVVIANANMVDAPYVMVDMPDVPVPGLDEQNVQIIARVPRDVLRHFILPGMTYAKLNELRRVHVSLWNVVTNAMVARARETFPDSAGQLPDPVLLEAMWYVDVYNGTSRNKTEARNLFALTDVDLRKIQVPGEPLFPALALIRRALVKHGSMQAVEQKKAQREAKKKDKVDARNAAQLAEKAAYAAMSLRIATNERLIEQLLLPHGYRNLDAFIRHPVAAVSKFTIWSWMRGETGPITNEAPEFTTLLVAYAQRTVELGTRREFNELYQYVTDEMFVRMVIAALDHK